MTRGMVFGVSRSGRVLVLAVSSGARARASRWWGRPDWAHVDSLMDPPDRDGLIRRLRAQIPGSLAFRVLMPCPDPCGRAPGWVLIVGDFEPIEPGIGYFQAVAMLRDCQVSGLAGASCAGPRVEFVNKEATEGGVSF